ncbi:hypothetical protein B0H16DRAFT_1855420 [Mycena metata]|uniref:Uncharacterized protein n=1 Tax=Mycena metata TaxID=1033252 RepID=A0AAD7N4D6_9AGAR|nr:hypothetical protein B0H16DRAFT_1855420 [Mycena metata]
MSTQVDACSIYLRLPPSSTRVDAGRGTSTQVAGGGSTWGRNAVIVTHRNLNIFCEQGCSEGVRMISTDVGNHLVCFEPASTVVFALFTSTNLGSGVSPTACVTSKPIPLLPSPGPIPRASWSKVGGNFFACLVTRAAERYRSGPNSAASSNNPCSNHGCYLTKCPPKQTKTCYATMQIKRGRCGREVGCVRAQGQELEVVDEFTASPSVPSCTARPFRRRRAGPSGARHLGGDFASRMADAGGDRPAFMIEGPKACRVHVASFMPGAADAHSIIHITTYGAGRCASHGRKCRRGEGMLRQVPYLSRGVLLRARRAPHARSTPAAARRFVLARRTPADSLGRGDDARMGGDGGVLAPVSMRACTEGGRAFSSYAHTQCLNESRARCCVRAEGGREGGLLPERHAACAPSYARAIREDGAERDASGGDLLGFVLTRGCGGWDTCPQAFFCAHGGTQGSRACCARLRLRSVLLRDAEMMHEQMVGSQSAANFECGSALVIPDDGAYAVRVSLADSIAKRLVCADDVKRDEHVGHALGFVCAVVLSPASFLQAKRVGARRRRSRAGGVQYIRDPAPPTSMSPSCLARPSLSCLQSQMGDWTALILRDGKSADSSAREEGRRMLPLLLQLQTRVGGEIMLFPFSSFLSCFWGERQGRAQASCAMCGGSRRRGAGVQDDVQRPQHRSGTRMRTAFGDVCRLSGIIRSCD